MRTWQQIRIDDLVEEALELDECYFRKMIVARMEDMN